MPRSSSRRPSDPSSSDDDSDYARRQPLTRTRRALSTSSGRGRRPQLADLAEHQSYHRPSSERRHVPTKDSDSDSESSSDDSYSARRRHRHRARSPSAAPLAKYRPPSRARSVDLHHHHHHSRRRSPSPPSRRRPASTFPIAPRDHHNTDRSSRHYPPSASHSHYPPSSSRSRRAPSSSRSHHHGRNSSPSARSHRSRRDHSPSSSDPPEKPERKNSDIFLGAARTAFTAGAIAALKLHEDDSPWLGPKGAKIVTAGLSAAAVDTIMEKKHPCRKGGLRHSMMRQATQLVIGNLVMMPAKKAEKEDMGGKLQGKMGDGARGVYHAGQKYHHRK